MSSRNQQFSGFGISTNSKQSKKRKVASKGADKLVAAFKPVVENLEPRQMLSGTPDASFNSGGKRSDDTGFQDLAHATLIEPSGKLLVAGESQGRFALLQYNNDGSLNWQALNGPGFPLSSVSAMTMQDGKIIVAGTSLDATNGDSEFAVARYDDNGTLDTTFGNNGTAVTDLGADTRDIAYGVAVQSDGKIVVVGSTGGAGQEDVALVRYTSEGELDNAAGTGFGAGQSGIVTMPQAGSESANAVAIGAGDEIIVAGHDGLSTLIQQYDANGNLLATHTESIGGTDSASSVAIQGSSFLVGGTVDGNFYAARFDSSLTLDGSFGSSGVTSVDFGGADSASGLAIAPDGKIVLAGTTDNGASGTQDFAVARLSADGSPDASFGTDGMTSVDFNGQNDVGAAVAVGADRKIAVVGYTAGPVNNDFAVTRLEGNSAPVIGTATANFDAIAEDATANLGNSVAELAGRLGITDADGDVAGLAITASDDTNGTWEYTTDGGTDWTAIGAVTPGTALLLSVDTMNRIRFVPAADFNTGSGATPTLSVAAWDGVQGTDGGTADVTDNSAHLNSFGATTGTLSQTVVAVNDAPSFTIGGDQTVVVGTAVQSIPGWAKNLSAGPADENGQTLSFVVSEISDPNNVVSGVSVDPNTGTLTFTPGSASGVATFSVALKDNGGGTDTSAAQTFKFTVAELESETWVNDNWVVTNDVGAAGLSQGDTVADTGAGDDGAVTGKTYGIDAFSTIQDGVDFTAGGGLEHVISGSYIENVVINKALDLAGWGQGNTFIYPSISGANTPGGSLGAGVSSVILVQSDNVSIHNLTIDGDNTSLTGPLSADVNGANIDARNGIITDHLSGVYNNLNVHDTTIKNIFLRGIYASSGGTFDLSNNTVDNVAGNAASIGIFNFGGSGNISGNTVTRANDAISANHSRGTTFTGNHISQSGSGIHSDNAGDSGGTPDIISSNDISNGGAGSYGIFVFVPYNTVTVSGNTVNGVEVGLAAFGGAGGLAQFDDNQVHVIAGGTGAFVTTDQLGFGSGDVAANFSGNVITGGVTGLAAEQTGGSTALVSVSGGSIGGTTTGIDATAGSTVNVGSVSISGNETGIKYSGGAGGLVINVNFDGSTDNGTDLLLADDAGTVDVGGGNAFAGDSFYIDNESAQNIDLSGNGTSFDETNNFRIEDKMFHKVDDSSKGLITWVANNVFVTSPETGSTDSNIERAINAANSGDTVNIENGTYSESNIAVDKSVTISGQSRAGVIIAPAIVDGHVNDNFTSASNGFLIGANGVTIENLTIDGNANGDLAGTQNFRNAILTNYLAGDFGDIGVDNVTISNIFRKGVGFYVTSNNKVTGDSVSNSSFDGIGTDASLSFESYAAIAAFQSDTTIDNVIITNSGAGIATNYFAGEEFAPKVTISGVQISGMHTDGTNPIVGMDLSGLADGSSISGNQIDVSGGNADIGIVVQYAASGADVTVSGNTITTDAGDTGMLLYQNADAAHPTLVSGNTFNGSGSATGILVTNDGSVFGETPNVGTTYASLSQNNVSGYGTGILVTGATSSAAISDNNINDNGVGVQFVSGGNGSVAGNEFDGVSDNGTDLLLSSDAGTVAVGAANHFAGDTFFINNQTAQNIDLSGNGTTFDETNNFRIEDKMFHKVDDSSKGLITWVANNVFVTSPGLGSTDSSIQRGIGAASSGDTVNIENGTYNESNITINKSLTINGQSRAGVILGPSIVDGHVNDNFTNASNGFLIGASGVTIENLTIDGNADGILAGTQNFRNAILTKYLAGDFGDISVDNVTISNIFRKGVGFYVTSNNMVTGDSVSNSSFDGIGTDASLSFESYAAIAAFQSDTTISDVIITNSGAGIATNYFAGEAYAPKLTISGVQISGMHTDGSNPIVGMDLSGLADGSSVSGNQIDVSGGNADIGIVVQYTASGADVTVSGNTITTDAGDTGMLLYQNVDAAHPTLVSGNTFNGSGSATGILVTNDGSVFGETPNVGTTYATLSQNNVTGYGVGVLVTGATSSAAISDNNINSNDVGVQFVSGGNGSVAGNEFDGVSDNGTDLLLSSDAGTVAVGAANHFAGDTFFINNQTAQNIDLSGNGTTFDETNDFRIEDKMFHKVDDSSKGLITWVANNIFVTTPGAGSTDSSIQRGIDAASSGNTVNVEAGLYTENPNVNKSLTLLGANAGLAGSGARGAETIVRSNGLSNTAVFTITANIVEISGFTIDGDDPNFAGATLGSGDDTNTSYGVRPTGAFNHITVDDNIIKHVAIGFRGDGASQNNVIANNWFDSVGMFDFGYAISLRQSFYADITDNLMTRVWTGVHLNDFHLAGGPATWTMSGNEIHSYAGGLLYWLQYGQATSLTIDNNDFSAESGATANNFGVLMVSIQDTIHPTFTNNTVSGQDYGIGLFNVSTSNPITLDGTNSVTGSKLAGVLLTDNLNFNPVGTTNFLAGGPGAASTVNIDGLSMTGNAGDGIRVDASLNTAQTVNVSGANVSGGLAGVGLDLIGTKAAASLNGSTITDFGTGIKVAGGTLAVGTGDSVVGGVTGLAISGASAVLSGNTLSDLTLTGQNTRYITLSDNALDGQEVDATGVEFDGVTGATATYSLNYGIENKIDHAVDDESLGLIRVKAGNIFVTTSSGSIQRGVDVASTGDQVNVADGTYTEQVDIGKNLTLQGQSQDGTVIKSPALLANNFVWSGITYRPIVLAHDANVTVAQLTVNGDGQGNANNRFTGIGFYNAGGTIDHTTVVGMRDATLDGVQHGYGIIARDDDSAARILAITENTVSDYQKNGIDVRGVGLDATIAGNTITGAGDTEVIAQNGIVVINAKAEITGNTVSGNENSGPTGGADPTNDDQATGILLLPAASGSTVDGNFIDGNDIGIYSMGSGITVSNNQLGNSEANRYEGILIDAGDTTVSGNTIQGGNFGVTTLPGASLTSVNIHDNSVAGAGVGIDINQASGDVSNNHVFGNLIGIRFSNGGTGLVAGTNFDGGASDSDNLTDLQLASDAGTVTIGSDNHFAGDLFFINNQTAQSFNLVGNGTTFDETNNFRIEDKMFHKVDDASKGLITWVANNIFITTPGAGSTDSSIQRGVNAASAGDTVNVEAGNYKENISINKSLSVVGPQAGVAGRDNSRGSGEAIITTNGAATAIFDISAPNVSISGFTLEGNDPAVTTATLTSGVDSNVLYGVRATAGATGGLNVTDNIIKDVFVGVRGDATASAASINNLIKDNWFDSVGAFDFGYAVTTRTNFYADVIDNLMTRVHSGVLNLNHFIAGPAVWTMSGNEIHSYAAGLWQNGQDSSATPLTVDGNTFSAETGALANNIGVLFTGVNNPGVIFTNNTISGQDYGMIIWGSTSNITLDGSNSINGGKTGLYVTDNLAFNPVTSTVFGVGSNQSVTVNGLKITGATVAGIVAQGGSKTTAVNISGTPISVGATATGITATNATLTVGAGNTITGGTTGLAIDGAGSAVTGKTLSNLTLTGQTGNYIALANNALDDQVIDATAVKFDGVTGTTATHAQRLAIEGKIHDEVDDSTLGLIQIAVADVTRPTVVSSQFHYENAPQRITIQFSEYVKDSLSLDDITLVELLSNTTISPDNMTLTYDEATNTATITFHDLPANYLSTGRYQLTINSAGVTDDSGNPLDGDGSGGDHVLSFFQMNGDANHDATVDFTDLVAVSQHYGIDDGNQTWATGDFNYDGKVDFEDLVALGQNYGTTLPPAPSPMTAPPVAAAAASAPVVASPAAAPVAAAPSITPAIAKPAAASVTVSKSKSVATVTATTLTTTNAKPVAKPAAKPVSKPVTKTVVKPAAKPLVKASTIKGVTPIQAGVNAPFAVRTQLRVQSRPANLIGDVLQKKDSATKKIFR